jgi:WD40 repeat protein/serine/threonine protein kinase
MLPTQISEKLKRYLTLLHSSLPNSAPLYLDAACAGAPEIRPKVEALLKAHDQIGQFLPERPSSPLSKEPEEIDLSKAQGLGQYKLLEKIGEGGCGIVYLAEQEEPVRRRVALKVIKLGMDTKSVIARFEAERQALAMMDHPNIAKVLDAGATEAGRPFFVMELVRGTKITDYCDQNNLSTRERLDLFIKVCHAIQHAHQKGLIHRDIKPSNILVTLHDGVAVPKVIDFGIAKATTDQRLTDKTLFTALEQFIGTPAYMSPEQAEMGGLDIDTRSDIYSLGVLLYEMLTGKTPFDAKELLASGLDAMRRTIREQEPVRPSTKLSQTLVAADVRRLKSPSGTRDFEDEIRASSRRLLRLKETITLLRSGDIDWIVMKCLEKDRSRRYETANDLASDLQRFLNNEAVLARPPTASYRFRKLVRRNQLAFAAGTLVALALVLGAAVSTWEAILATRAQRVSIAQRKLADLQSALEAWEEGDLRRATNLIEASRPPRGQVPPFEWRYLQKLCRDQSYATFGGPNDEYGSGIFIGRDLLLLGHGKRLIVYDLASRKEQLLIEDQDGIGLTAICPANTNLLAAATEDGRIKIWDLAARAVLMVFEGHPNSIVKDLNFSPDGRVLSSTSCDYDSQYDNSVKLWDLASRNPHGRTLHRYSYGGGGVVFSPDGRLLFSTGTDSVIRVWNVATGKEAAAPLQGHTCWVGALAISPDGLSMASAGGESAVKVWNVGSRQFERELLGDSTPVDALAFSPDGRVLATGSRDRTVRLWDYQTGRQLALLCGNADRIVLQLSFSPDGRWLASKAGWSGSVKSVKVWDTRALDGLVLRGPPVWVQDLDISTDGRHLTCVASGSSVVNLWDLEKRNSTELKGHSNETVTGVAFSPNGRMLATGSHDRTVRLWDVNDHRSLGILTNGFPVGSLAFSPDGLTLIVGGSSLAFLEHGPGGLQFWDVSTKQATGTIAGDSTNIFELALSRNGSVLATSHDDGVVNLWDAHSRRLLHRFASPFGNFVISLAFSPSEPLLAGSDENGNIVIYNIKTMKVDGPPLKAHTYRVMSLAFSPDGRTLASAGGGLKLWNMASRQLTLSLKGHVGSVTGVAFAQDGNILASCGADSTVRLWLAAPFADTHVVEQVYKGK